MSFEPNDINTIHLGNYEEFFILYMDNELSEEQKKMVDAFLLANPDLRGEFDILMSTKLPVENFSFDKDALFAGNMKLSSVDEELLLYIDNELPADKKNIVELELASNKDYKLQHQALVQTKLDPSEKIIYPNKEELYRRTERVAYFKPWMRVAAAVLIIVIGGMFYFRNSSSPTVGTQDPQITAGKTPVTQSEEKKSDLQNEKTTPKDSSNDMQLANANSPQHRVKPQDDIEEKKLNSKSEAPQNVIAYTPPNEVIETLNPDKIKTTTIEGGYDPKKDESNPQTFVANTLDKDIVNNPTVTYSPLERNTIESPVDQKNGSIADNRKGSVKGFLRKATRMIEKRTGIDPTDEDGKLLIGSVAINLK